MNRTRATRIACGMYAFTEAQQSAWRQLFDRFTQLAGKQAIDCELSFDHDPQSLLTPGLWFGHTCGYPLMTSLQTHLAPFCLPLFDVPGTRDKQYSSHLIVAANSPIESVVDARGQIVAINNLDSNSGMNVLRHAVAEVNEGNQFFSRVRITGGHLYSLQAVAEGAADIAAIDCVSYQLIEDWRPELTAGLRIIASSASTCGLPFVMPHRQLAEANADMIIACLNEALASCDGAVTDTLHLTGFAEVALDDYRSIVELEEFASARGYPHLE